MTDSSPSPAPMPHIFGESYEFNEVRAFLGGDPKPPNFVIHRNGEVIGLCLGLGWNPRAESEPCEVWVGRKGDQPKWGIKLSETKGLLPVYVRRTEGGKWFYNGEFQVTSDSTDPAIIRPRLQPPTIVAIAQLVFLKRINPPAAPTPPAEVVA
jgi:hypothetical protein